MRRGLKGWCAAPCWRSGDRGCVNFPDEEGTESNQSVAVSRRLCCCVNFPDEEGTERRREHDSGHERFRSCVNFPDEEGTESQNYAAVGAVGAMLRELPR